jgi:4-amino-4-deoxy-L-arabinose transferase-like glycosyltransferase
MFLYAFWVPVHPDEAYYWTWSQHLALSYFDGPPLTAWLLRLATDVFGIHTWSIKIIAVTSVSISALLIYRLSVLLFDYDVGFKALLIFLLIPITQATNFITTLDPLLMLFWSLGLYLFWLWLERPTLTKTVFLGITLGLGLLSKYPMILFLPSAFVFLLITPYRKYLLNYKPYLIILIACLVSLPIIIWNQQHHWLSLGFQWHHGAGSSHFSLTHFDMFILGQLGAFNPIYFIALVIFSIRYFKDYKIESLQFLAIPTLIVLILFGYFGLFNRSEANWTMPAYISASILLAYFCDKRSFSVTLWLGFLLNILVIILLKFPYFSPHQIDKVNPVIKFYGFPTVIDPLEQALSPKQLLLPIVSNSYQNASEVELAIKNHPHVCIITPTRQSETTMQCRQFKDELNKKAGEVLWIGPKNDLILLTTRMKHCQIIAASHYSYRTTNRHWVAAECSGKLKE